MTSAPAEDDPSGDDPSGDDEPAGTYTTAFGDLTFDDDDDDDSTEPDSARRRRNNRVLITGIAIGAALVLALGIVGVVLVRSYLDQTSSLTARMSIKYQAQYRSCLNAGGFQDECATLADTACVKDRGWDVVTDRNARAKQISDICLFGPDAGT